MRLGDGGWTGCVWAQVWGRMMGGMLEIVQKVKLGVSKRRTELNFSGKSSVKSPAWH
jgi:hypothetical protein